MKYLKPLRAGLLAIALSVGIFTVQVAPVALLSAVVVTQTACPKSNDIAAVADEIARDIDAALPIFRSNGQDTSKLEQVKGYAVKVSAAFKSGDITTAVQYAGLLINAFENEIVAQINRVTDPTIRTVLFVALVLGRRHLSELADKIDVAAPKELAAAAAQPAVQGGLNPAATIQEFRQKKKWRCRNSISGRYAAMEYCRLNPSTSQVETY